MSQCLPRIDPTVIAARLADAEAAYDALRRGLQISVVSYGNGDGTKSVTYTRASAANLLSYIADLKRQLGVRARRPIGLRF